MVGTAWYTLCMSLRRKIIDLFVVIAFVLFASATSILLDLNFLVTTLLFFGLPSAYLIYRKPNNLKKTTVNAAILGLIWGFGFDYVAELNNAWDWGGAGLVFPDTFFGVVSLDVMIWYFLWFFSIIAFYEYFVEYDNSNKISKNAITIAFLGIVLVTIIVLLPKTSDILLSQHTYLKLGSIALIPFLYVIIRQPKLIPKVLSVIPYFFFLYLVFELTALHQDLWSFSGDYIGIVAFGGLLFPFEELFFWITVSSAVAVSYYELTVDDMA